MSSLGTDMAIRVESLSKKYTIGSNKSESFRDTISRAFNKREKFNEKNFWALKDISFEIKKGEAVGIIGKNGAGKSTLLKVLSRITEPTTGKIILNGRVSSLLEVGTGFHPELTGKENIYLNGTILGMSRREVKEKFDEIVAFSGVEKFLNTPVKHYSSGMYVRLAFAVAAHLEPEILIIDEVLAVGDAEFQKKCLGKMEDVANQGRTVIFVSHNMDAVERLCSSAMLLQNGCLTSKAKTNQVIEAYSQSAWTSNIKNGLLKLESNKIIKEIRIKSSSKNPTQVVQGCELEISVNVKSPSQIKFPVLGIVIKDHTNSAIVGINNKHYTLENLTPSGMNHGWITIFIPSLPLLPANYWVDIYFGDGNHDLDSIQNQIMIKVVNVVNKKTPLQPLSYALNKIHLPSVDWRFKPN